MAEWSHAARPILTRIATEYGRYVTYGELARMVQEDTDIFTGSLIANWIGSVLGAVADEQRPGEPLLTSFVVASDGRVGPGYAIPVKQREGSVPEDLDAHAAIERLECHRYFGATLPRDGGTPTLTREAATRRANATRAPRPRQPVCPNCFLEMPTSGTCDCAS